VGRLRAWLLNPKPGLGVLRGRSHGPPRLQRAGPGPSAVERTDSLPVITTDGALIGIIAAVDIERAIDQGPDDNANGASLAREVPRLLASDSLEDAVRALGSSDDEGLPVTDEHDQLIGWITHRRVLRAYLARYGTPDHPDAEPDIPTPEPTVGSALANHPVG